ncbi:MAG TPA: glycine cleavage T C-terminal barrel domain-containing protein [Bryobacteraceae bacterium]|nr:glycine cleavage T C-terminal barrel domain-containing protein [Bryobacteraceae bacterium]
MKPGYAALRDGAAWLDLSARAKIRVTGDDRARLLHAMSTNHVERLKPGQGCYAFFLNAQGRILADAHILCFADHFLLDTGPELRVKLFEHLDRYIIADDVALDDETDRVATIALEGPESGAVLEKLAPIPEAPFDHVEWDAIAVARISSTSSPGFFLFLPVESKREMVERLESAGAVAATPEDARIVRLEHGRPRYGDEISEKNLVQETGQLHAVNFNKGCYLGQEIVERVRSQAKLHRILRRLEIDTQNPPAAGAKTEEAEIASAAFSPALGKTIALAYVRTQFADPGTKFKIGDAPAMVAEPSN